MGGCGPGWAMVRSRCSHKVFAGGLALDQLVAKDKSGIVCRRRSPPTAARSRPLRWRSSLACETTRPARPHRSGGIPADRGRRAAAATVVPRISAAMPASISVIGCGSRRCTHLTEISFNMRRPGPAELGPRHFQPGRPVGFALHGLEKCRQQPVPDRLRRRLSFEDRHVQHFLVVEVDNPQDPSPVLAGRRLHPRPAGEGRPATSRCAAAARGVRVAERATPQAGRPRGPATRGGPTRRRREWPARREETTRPGCASFPAGPGQNGPV